MSGSPRLSPEQEHLDLLMTTLYLQAGGLKTIDKVQIQSGPPIHDPDGKKILVDAMLESGALPRVVAGVTEIPLSTIQRWQGNEPVRSREQGVLRLLNEWYAPVPGKVSLEDYCSTFESLLKERHAVFGNLVTLREAGMIFSYDPTPNDAYLFGANHGNGCLNSNFTLLFTGTDENLASLERFVPIRPFCNGAEKMDGSRIYSPSLGRLYSLLGLPAGVMSGYSVSIPEWIRGGDFGRSFVRGLLDTTGAYFGGSFYLSKGAHKDDRPALSCYLECVADIFSENGVALTKKGYSINPKVFRTDNASLSGKVWIATKENNLRTLKEAFQPCSPSFLRLLEEKISSYGK